MGHVDHAADVIPSLDLDLRPRLAWLTHYYLSMSQAVHETINMGDSPWAAVGTCTCVNSLDPLVLTTSPLTTSSSCPGGYPPRPDQAQTSQKVPESDLHDSSVPLFSMYLELAEEEDIKIAERWRADARSILVFVSPHSFLCYLIVCIDRRS